MLQYEQAQATCDEHSYLIGEKIKNGIRVTGEVTRVIIAPFDGISQHRFLKEYMRTQDEHQALKQYKGSLFTILLVVKPIVNPTQLFTLELDAFMRQYSDRMVQFH